MKRILFSGIEAFVTMLAVLFAWCLPWIIAEAASDHQRRKELSVQSRSYNNGYAHGIDDVQQNPARYGLKRR